MLYAKRARLNLLNSTADAYLFHSLTREIGHLCKCICIMLHSAAGDIFEGSTRLHSLHCHLQMPWVFQVGGPCQRRHLGLSDVAEARRW